MAEKRGSSDKGRPISSMSRRWPATIEMGPWPSTSVLLGADKVVRAAIIKTVTGEYKRPAAKLCVLPIEDCTNNEETL